jgi:hypothetical protein
MYIRRLHLRRESTHTPAFKIGNGATGGRGAQGGSWFEFGANCEKL